MAKDKEPKKAEGDPARVRELLLEAFEINYRVTHKLLRPCPTKVQALKLNEKIAAHLGVPLEELEKPFR